MTTLTSAHTSHDVPWAAVVSTAASPGQAVLRVTLAAVLLPHGAQHLLGLFGGYGFSGTMQWMTGTLGIPAAFAAAGILLEFFGPLLLLAGIGGRIVAAALAVFMMTAASTHFANGFFMNWFGTLPAGVEGFEFHLLAVAMAVAIALGGSGSWSVDRRLTARVRGEE